MNVEDLATDLRRRPLVDSQRGEALAVGVAGVERMLPHRDPMRLVDAVSWLDLERRCIRGSRSVAEADPVFAGHFPEQPVYPGVLLVEMVGQLGLCLAWLDDQGGDVHAPAPPLDVRLFKIHHAAFLAAVEPGVELTLEARAVERDGLTGVVAGQVWRGETLATTCVLEMYFV